MMKRTNLIFFCLLFLLTPSSPCFSMKSVFNSLYHYWYPKTTQSTPKKEEKELSSDQKALNEDLLDAATKGNLGLVEICLDQGANIDYQDELGNTALHYAAYYEKDDIVLYLLENKANVNARNINGLTPLHSTCFSSTQKETLCLHTKNSKDH
jgi:ankyrin repeat protein